MPILFGIIVLILCSTCAIKVFSPPQTPQQVAAAQLRQEEDDAKRMAKELVREKAKLPAGVEFAPLGDFKVVKKDGAWEVSAFYEALAANGTKARTNFVCNVKKDGYQWSLTKLAIPR